MREILEGVAVGEEIEEAQEERKDNLFGGPRPNAESISPPAFMDIDFGEFLRIPNLNPGGLENPGPLAPLGES